MAVLGRGVVPADTPVVRADDIGVLRGDGVFETMHVRGGQPWLLRQHLDRMARSAARLDLDLPPAAALTTLAAQACEQWPADREGALRLICTRGPEGGPAVTVLALLGPVPPASRAARSGGVTAITASLGVAADARTAAPWLLGGAKTLSYAMNMAALRWAAAQGADELLWVATDGWALEAPTSSLLWSAGDELGTVPATTTGILPGCTARYLLDHSHKLDLRPVERMITPAELRGVDGVWLVSSVRGVAPVRRLDDADLPTSPLTAALLDLAGFPTA
ncbi:4-amino-4-deoxychorismate lyase [Pilimelia anulata]|uniref:4-amino-4-deoxychorismate lyase n=1 Tax=Pilimelia anulata TaxID=53371 RepID=A0A8J3B6B7_9ACTN|nr:4-amino-4-deoxychorismate lyase [Pilimelia anulata]